MRRSGLAVASAFAIVVVAGLTHPESVRAECTFYPIPPATDAARSASEIIVGTVIQNFNDDPFDFRLRIDHVLRGPASVGEVRRFKALFPGWPLSRYPLEGKHYPPCEPIPGWKGNVMALSLHAIAPDGKTRYNGASWIKGRLPFNQDVPRTTLAEMRALAALPLTDAVATTSTPAPAVASVSVALGLIGVMTFLVAMMLLGLRGSRPGSP